MEPDAFGAAHAEEREAEVALEVPRLALDGGRPPPVGKTMRFHSSPDWYGPAGAAGSRFPSVLRPGRRCAWHLGARSAPCRFLEPERGHRASDPSRSVDVPRGTRHSEQFREAVTRCAGAVRFQGAATYRPVESFDEYLQFRLDAIMALSCARRAGYRSWLRRFADGRPRSSGLDDRRAGAENDSQRLLVKKRDPAAKIDRAFIVRSTQSEVQRLGGWAAPVNHPVYVLEMWGDMTLCHSAPAGADPCDETDGLTIVHNAETLETDDVVYGRLGGERLGPTYELDLGTARSG